MFNSSCRFSSVWIALFCMYHSAIFAEDVSMKSAPYGSWQSPISAQNVAEGAAKFSEVKLIDRQIYWLESRPSAGGRTTLMKWSAQEGEKELLSQEYNVRSRVHEYGGGALLIAGEKIYFINDQDQQVHCLDQVGNIRKVTSLETCRFADGYANAAGTELYYVMEKHGGSVENSIVKVDPSSGVVQTIASGNDFYSNPRISPDGRQLAYLTWNHPNMPWDGSELWVIDLQSKKQRLVAGGLKESIADPKWSADGKLYFISDRLNWWNIYREKDSKPVCAIEGECALPQWIFGGSLMGFSNEGIFCSYVKNGSHKFAKITSKGTYQIIDLPYTTVSKIEVEDDQVAMIASSPNEPSSIILYNLSNGATTIVKKSRSKSLDQGYLSQPKAIEFPTTDGYTAHAFYYPPTNPNFRGMADEKPPLLVQSHGGPTWHTSPGYSLETLFWTSRGFAVITVNYGGSTGYGRKYRDRLKDNWGIVDVDDCTNAALYCVKKGLADPKRLAIEGGSAGGYTTLAALAFRDVFQVGADYFGVSDLERLTLDTHKFESRYLDQLLGPYPEKKAVYIERSPIHSAGKIHCPIIIFQGAEDAVVPPSQSEMMFNSLKERKIPTAYLLFQGEQHGFRKAENVERSLEAQLYFFSKVLNFPLNETIKPIQIDNL